MRTAWTAGRLTGSGPQRLVFGRMYEDPDVELAALPSGRVLAIASAGDVAFALAAAGREVVAVDVNLAQVDYVRGRMAGAAVSGGQADHYLARASALLPVLGMTARRLREFFDLDDPGLQVDAWRKLAGRRFRAALGIAFGPALRLAYRNDLARALPAGFATELLSRLERGFGIHPNRGNSLARALFGQPARPARPHRIEVEHAEVVEFLRAQPPASFDGFAFSNITEGAPDGFRDQLLDAAHRVARPGGIAVLRALGSGRNREDESRAATDRALIWGGIEAVTLR